MEVHWSNVNLMLINQYTLLTEILKKAGFPSSCLVRMIKEYGITPSWEHIPLPQGIIVQLPGKKRKRKSKKALQIDINMALTPAPVKAVHSARAKRHITSWFSSLRILHIQLLHFHRDPI